MSTIVMLNIHDVPTTLTLHLWSYKMNAQKIHFLTFFYLKICNPISIMQLYNLINGRINIIRALCSVHFLIIQPVVCFYFCKMAIKRLRTYWVESGRYMGQLYNFTCSLLPTNVTDIRGWEWKRVLLEWAHKKLS